MEVRDNEKVRCYGVCALKEMYDVMWKMWDDAGTDKESKEYHDKLLEIRKTLNDKRNEIINAMPISETDKKTLIHAALNNVAKRDKIDDIIKSSLKAA